jgi:membrane protease YdiL (CAAX protease family)
MNSLLNPVQLVALVSPLVLIPVMLWVFRAFHRRWGYPLGYLLGFVVYWVSWCIAVPVILLGGFGGVIRLFSPFPAWSQLALKTHILLWWPLVFPCLFVFMPRARRANRVILLLSVVLGVVIGVTEEILWRGVYMRLFPDSVWFNLVYPSLLFALWHICPQRIVPNRLPGGSVSFVVYALLLGVSYALTVYQTGSIAWATIAHSLHDTLGLGGFAYAVWFTASPSAQPRVEPQRPSL